MEGLSGGRSSLTEQSSQGRASWHASLLAANLSSVECLSRASPAPTRLAGQAAQSAQLAHHDPPAPGRRARPGAPPRLSVPDPSRPRRLGPLPRPSQGAPLGLVTRARGPETPDPMGATAEILGTNLLQAADIEIQAKEILFIRALLCEYIADYTGQAPRPPPPPPPRPEPHGPTPPPRDPPARPPTDRPSLRPPTPRPPASLLCAARREDRGRLRPRLLHDPRGGQGLRHHRRGPCLQDPRAHPGAPGAAPSSNSPYSSPPHRPPLPHSPSLPLSCTRNCSQTKKPVQTRAGGIDPSGRHTGDNRRACFNEQ